MAVLTIAADHTILVDTVAARLVDILDIATRSFGSATIALSGGNTPRALYSALADPMRPWRDRIDWPRVHLFWSDERVVGPEHPDSNFRMAHESLIAHVPIPPAHVHRVRVELEDAAEAAQLYDQEITRPFDVVLVGVGGDAHIASIFPGSALLDDRGPQGSALHVTESSRRADLDGPRNVAAVWAPHLNAWRITLTPAALLDAHAILVIVTGEEKADAVYAALEGPLDVARWPAQLLRQASDRVEWFIDAPAADRLRRGPLA